MKLVVGLGNPGEKYVGVRHNLGFMVVDELGKKMEGGSWKIGVEDGKWKMDKKFKAEILKLVHNLPSAEQDDGEQLILAKPQTYMNKSGMAVKLLTSEFRIPISDLIVVHDDLDILLGKVKVRKGGAAAGHHGVESIIAAIGDGFTRVRVGIGNQKSHSGEHEKVHFNAEHFVLEPFMPAEKSHVKHAIKQAISALTELISSDTLGSNGKQA